MREFESGATRNVETSKIDPEGFLHPSVIRSFCRYMDLHRLQADGQLRSSDNWQKGIPRDVYMKSLWRHFLDLWDIHRGGCPISPETAEAVTIEEAVNAIMFNAMGYLFEELKHGPGQTGG